MAKTNLYMNWTGVTVTYGTSPTTINLSEVVDLEVGRKGEVKRWTADAGVFAKALAVKNKTRTITIKGGAINLLASVPEDTLCTIVGVLNDLNNGTGSGAITVTAVRGTVTSNPFKGQNNEFGLGDLEFECSSVDGTTDPITYAVAS